MSEINFNTDCTIQQYYPEESFIESPKSSLKEQTPSRSIVDVLKSSWSTFCDLFSTTTPLSKETWSFYPEHSDGRPWKLDFFDQTEEGYILKFTLPEENVNTWSEIITIQVLPRCLFTPREFCFSMLHDIETSYKRSIGGKMGYKVHSETPNSLVCEWYDYEREDPIHECFKVIKTENALYRFAYTTHNLSEVKERIPIWKEILEDIHISSLDQLSSTTGIIKV